MLQFTGVAYSGAFSASGSGTDPDFGFPFTVTASGGITATLSEDAGGHVSGTWSYSGSADATSEYGSQSEAVGGSGTVSGTEGSLTFTASSGIFVAGTGSLSANDKTLTFGASWTFQGASGGASGSMAGDPGTGTPPPSVPTEPADVLGVPDFSAASAVTVGDGTHFLSPQYVITNPATGAWTLASPPAPGTYPAGDNVFVSGNTRDSELLAVAKSLGSAIMDKLFDKANDTVKELLGEFAPALTIAQAETNFITKTFDALQGAADAALTGVGGEEVEAKLQAARTGLYNDITSGLQDLVVDDDEIANVLTLTHTLWDKAKVSMHHSTEFFTIDTDSGPYNGDNHNDTVIASAAADILNGGGGNDVLFGDLGNDRLNGGSGFDVLFGGSGADKFVFDATALTEAQLATPKFDHIADYRQGNTGHYSAAEADKIDVSGLTGGSSINGFVKVFDQGDSGTHLMVDANGAAGGVHYVKMAQLDGIHEGQTVNVITNSAAPAGITVGVDSNQGYAGNFNAGSDGNSDLIWVNDTSRAIKLFELNGHSSGSQIAANLSVGTLPTGWNISGIGDFNNDGNSDLLLQSNTGALKFWEMNGATVAHNLNAGSLPAGWHVKGTGDFNHDNISDVVLQNDTSGAVKLWEFNGHASGAQLLHNLNVANLPSNWGIVGVGDFNGDNNDDLLLRLDTGQIKVWEMTGNASGAQILANLNVSNLTLDWHIEGIGDFNNDGKSDMLLVNDSGALKLWEMNGATIAHNLNAGTLASTQHVAGTGDFNGDGFDDILLRYDNGQAQLIELNGAASGNQILHNLTVTTLDAGWSTQNHHYDLV